MGIETALVGGGAMLAGGLLQADAANRASDTQLEGTYAGIGEQRKQFDLGRQDMAPYRDAGTAALGKLSALINSYQPFDGTELANDPGYQFGLNEGTRAVEQGAAARGGLFSGKTMRDLVKFGQDYGNTMFDRRGSFRLGEQAQRYNQLAGVAGTGQSAAMGGAQLGAQSAGTISDLLTQGGNARAAGIVGQSNALGNAFGNIGNMYLQQSMLDKLMPKPAPTGGVYGA